MAGISSIAAFFGYGGPKPPAPTAPVVDPAPDLTGLAAAQQATLSARRKVKAVLPGPNTTTNLAGSGAPAATTASKTLLGL